MGVIFSCPVHIVLLVALMEDLEFPSSRPMPQGTHALGVFGGDLARPCPGAALCSTFAAEEALG